MISLGNIEDAFNYFLGVYLGIVKSGDTEIAGYSDYLEFPMEEARERLFKTIVNLSVQNQEEILKIFIEFFIHNKLDDIGYFEELVSGMMENVTLCQV